MKKGDLIGGGIFLALGIFIFIFTSGFPTLDKGHPGPALFPRILAVLFVAFGGIVFLRGYKGEKTEENRTDEGLNSQNYFNPVFILILIVAYMALSNRLGFLITGFLVMSLMMFKLRVPYLRGLVISVLVTLFVNIMFAKILRVPLPPGFLSW